MVQSKAGTGRGRALAPADQQDRPAQTVVNAVVRPKPPRKTTTCISCLRRVRMSGVTRRAPSQRFRSPPFFVTGDPFEGPVCAGHVFHGDRRNEGDAEGVFRPTVVVPTLTVLRV